MSKFETLTQTKFSNLTFRVDTPEGSMYVAVIEDPNGNPISIDVQAGKSGTMVQAWAISISKIMTVAMEHGVTIDHFIKELNGQHTSLARRSGDHIVRSGPEGICLALIKYRLDRHQRAKKSA